MCYVILITSVLERNKGSESFVEQLQWYFYKNNNGVIFNKNINSGDY